MNKNERRLVTEHETISWIILSMCNVLRIFSSSSWNNRENLNNVICIDTHII